MAIKRGTSEEMREGLRTKFLTLFGHNLFTPPLVVERVKGVMYNSPCTQAARGGRSVSHKQTFLLSEECPAVAIRLEDPTNPKSLAVLLCTFKLYKF